MHFRLRTVFIVFTAVAIYTAVHVALLQNIGPAGLSRGVFAAEALPLFVVWVVAAVWVFENRRNLVAADLVLVALLLNIGWAFANEAITAMGYQLLQSSGRTNVSWLFGVSGLVGVAIKTVSWGLLLLAFVRANRARNPAASTRTGLPPEPGASPWDQPAQGG
jgi:uncharacterized membrane protein